MDVPDLVTRHYGIGGLAETVLSALQAHGVDTENLTAEDLAPVDELHAGGSAATQEVLRRLQLSPGQRLLDVGSGIGGPARLAAATLPVQVTGIDLTPEFVEAARDLTRQAGLDDRVTFQLGSGARMPFDEDSFDAAMMIHVGMNVDDKASLFADVRRVLRPGGRFVVFDQMRLAEGALDYPLPWADDEQSSFVETPDEYASHLSAAGFTVEATEDLTASSGPPPRGPDALSPAVVFGDDFVRRIRANIKATDAGLLAAVLVVARA
jgi:SAM-dependent methyltransferase